MENWMVAAFICAAVAFGMAGQAWVSWLEHKRRTQALDVIKTALQAGKEPPPQLYEYLRQAEAPKAPWTEAFVFGALSFGFWLAFAHGDGDRRTAFLVIAISMTATALGCLALAVFRPGGAKSSDDDER